MSVKNNKKIILINPPLSISERYGQLGQAGGMEPPLGLCYLGSVIRQAGFEVKIIDAQARKFSPEETAKLIMNFEPSYVGLSASTMSIESASYVAYLIKGLNSNIKIIIGGCHVSALPIETLKEYQSFNIGVVGEGEDTIRGLLLALYNNEDLKKVKGIVIRENGNIYLSEPRSRIINLDSLPYPAFDLLPEPRKFYRLPMQSLVERYSFSLVTSRGCPGRCSFCDKKVFGDYVSMHSAEYIIEMVSILNKNYKINNIMFEDDNFMISKQRLQAFSDLINKRRLKIKWTALASICSIDKELLEIAKEGGCWQISYGIESGNQRILDFYNKGVTKDKIQDVIELTKRVGLKIKCFFMWGNPTEDNNSIRETSNFIKKLDVDDISITFFTPYPGAKLWSDIKSYGDFNQKWRKMSCFELVFKPHGLKKEYLDSTRKQVLKYFYFRPKTIFSYLIRIKTLSQLKDLILSAFHLFNYISGNNNQARKYVIVNADDFGLTKGINQGIIKAFKEGIVKSASILAVGEAYDDAVILAKANPGLDAGIHLCLTEEKPLLRKEEIPTLVNKRGYFFKSYYEFFLNYLLGKLNFLEIKKELDAQINKVIDSGLHPTHIDSHGHIHVLPKMLDIVIELAKKYKISYIRYPNEKLSFLSPKPERYLYQWILKLFCCLNHQKLKETNFLKIIHFLGFLESGHLSLKSLNKALKGFDFAELVCHPGKRDQDLAPYSHWGYSWEEELELLTSLEIKQTIKEANLELVNFKDLS